MTNLYRVGNGTNGSPTDLDQVVDALAGTNDVGAIAAFAPINTPVALTATINTTSGNLTGAYQYKVALLTGYWQGQIGVGTLYPQGNTGGGTASNSVSPSSQQANLSNIPIGGTGVVARAIYRTKANGSTYYFLTQISDNVTTSWIDNIADASLTVVMPSTNTTGSHFAGDGHGLTGITSSSLVNGAATDTVIGNRTVDDTATPNTGPTTITNLFSFFGKMIRQITGKGIWTAAPAITLETVSTYLNQGVKTTDNPTFAGLSSNGRSYIKSGNKAVDIQYDSTADKGIIGSSDLGVGWKPLSIVASALYFNPNGAGDQAILYTGNHSHQDVTAGARPTFAGMYLTDTLIMDNDKYIIGKQTDGTPQILITMASDNNVYVGSLYNQLRLQSNGAITLIGNTILNTTNNSDSDGQFSINSTSANGQLIVKNAFARAQFMAWENQGVRIGSRNHEAGGVGDVNFTVDDTIVMTLAANTIKTVNRMSIFDDGLAVDASLHIKSAGSAGGRSTQINHAPGTTNAHLLNIMASKNAAGEDQWWSWGVSSANRWTINPGVGLSTGGMYMDGSGNANFAGTLSSTALYLGNEQAIYFRKVNGAVLESFKIGGDDHTYIGNNDITTTIRTLGATAEILVGDLNRYGILHYGNHNHQGVGTGNSPTFNGAYLTNYLIMDNDKYIVGKQTDGTQQILLTMGSDNNVYLGNYSVPIKLRTSSGNFTINDQAVWHQGNAPANFSTNGYQKLPNGFILQWGTNSMSGVPAINPSFPIAFPNVCLTFVVSSTTNNVPVQGFIINTSQFSITQSSSAAVTASWIAIGY
jgi:hypothetical protein